MDSQSYLSALNVGPLLQHAPTQYDYSYSWKLLLQVSRICSIILQFVPAHVGIERNEKADIQAKKANEKYPVSTQLRIPIEYPTLRTCMKVRLRKAWKFNLIGNTTRRITLGVKSSNLRKRAQLPRALQALYSRWRLGEVETAGEYPRRMNWIQSPKCRFCSCPKETIIHLLMDCPGLTSYRYTTKVAIGDLQNDSPAAIYRIARLDDWLRYADPVNEIPDFGVTEGLRLKPDAQTQPESKWTRTESGYQRRK